MIVDFRHRLECKSFLGCWNRASLYWMSQIESAQTMNAHGRVFLLCRASGVPCPRVVEVPQKSTRVSVACVRCEEAHVDASTCSTLPSIVAAGFLREVTALGCAQHRTSLPTVCTAFMGSCHLELCCRRYLVLRTQSYSMKMITACGHV